MYLYFKQARETTNTQYLQERARSLETRVNQQSEDWFFLVIIIICFCLLHRVMSQGSDTRCTLTKNLMDYGPHRYDPKLTTDQGCNYDM